jgi:hypothetical protein
MTEKKEKWLSRTREKIEILLFLTYRHEHHKYFVSTAHG